ncbi:MAG TPA: spore germination protein [Syntrophomonadaceae bacterium]|nr:spore germination protein [Syntrophomonadaceae bacterium]
MRYKKPRKPDPTPPNRDVITKPLSNDLQQNSTDLRTLLERCSDVVFKEFSFGPQRQWRGLMIFFDGLVDKRELEQHLLKPLMMELNMLREERSWNKGNVLQLVQESVVSVAEVKPVEDIQAVCHHVGSGDAVLLIDGYNKALVAGTRSWQGRSVQAPENEAVIRGPKESFTETIRFNTALLRRRIKSTNFKIETMVLGRITKTDVVVCYIDSVASPELVAEVKERLSAIDIDGVLDTGYLEEFLEDNHRTIFAQIEYTEKPDRVCGHLLEGQVCIMVDGSPIALILPTSFPRFWIASEDYYERFLFASLTRIIRFTSFFVALLLPSLFVATITYHHEMVPSPLYQTIAATREGVPFPAFVEALLLEITFELLREAGIRLPHAIGPAISIVGALIIGDAAVKAGLVSTPMVVIVAFTGIASFVVPAYNAGISVRLARFGFLLVGGLMGLFGIVIALLIMLIHMASLQSFGLHYLSPVAPFNKREMTDIIVRRPWYMTFLRPSMKGMENEIRQTRTNVPQK